MRKKVSIISFITFSFLLFPSETFANTDTSKPILNIQKNDSGVKLEWAVEIPESDVLYKTGFETGDLLPNLNYTNSDQVLPDNRKYGGQSFTTKEKFTGNRSLMIKDSYTNGNVFTPGLNGSYTLTGESWADFNHKRFYMANNTNLSLSFRAKTTGEGTIKFSGTGGAADYGTPMDITFLQDVKVGDRTVKVSDVYFFKDYVDKGQRFYLALSKGLYNYGYVTGYNIANSTITLNKPFEGTFKKGDNVLRHYHRSPVSFSERKIKKQDGWALVNVNTKIANYKDYNTLNRGFYLSIKTLTHDTVYLDDVKVGYATRTQVLRDDEVIYDGYLSDLEDTTARDKSKPDSISNYQIQKENNKTFVVFEKPKDYGTTYEYVVKAIPKNGIPLTSEKEEIEIISGVKGFSYVIDDNPHTIPNNTINSTTGKIEIPKNLGPKNYLHIRAIDEAGNASDTAHYFVNKGDLSLMNIFAYTTTWTNGNVDLEVDAISADKIVLPDGTIVTGSHAIFTATENGIYTFLALGEAGNIVDMASYDVRNIDRKGKEVLIIPEDEKWRNKDIEVKILKKD